MSGLSVSILTLSKRITETPNADEHGSAVMAQLAFANHIFEGVLSLKSLPTRSFSQSTREAGRFYSSWQDNRISNDPC